MKSTDQTLKSIVLFISIPFLFLLCFYGLEMVYGQLSSEEEVVFFRELIMMILSGFFSATIAYIVSSLRIKQEQKKEIEKAKLHNKRLINLLRIEIEGNKTSLEKNKDVGFEKIDNNSLEAQLSFVIYNRYIDKIILDDNILLLLIDLHKNIAFFKTRSAQEKGIAYGPLDVKFKQIIEMLQ